MNTNTDSFHAEAPDMLPHDHLQLAACSALSFTGLTGQTTEASWAEERAPPSGTRQQSVKRPSHFSLEGSVSAAPRVRQEERRSPGAAPMNKRTRLTSYTSPLGDPDQRNNTSLKRYVRQFFSSHGMKGGGPSWLLTCCNVACC